ncbi:hypothetical protein OG738_36260 [Amycolatopsis sp. NBC_01488]|uniref:hypothetical protein n=1 Tax=Amycolatopsis sp. NBC_01488 TaxID=2903563 RepID=UPI002E290EA4|nr:hypothetical protein [Amycolatopsis sp. NBC_01488]
MAALVSRVHPEATVVELVNLAPAADHTVVVPAGAFGEHTIRTACDDPSWVGDLDDYGHSEPRVTSASTRVDGPRLEVRLPRSATVRLGLRTHPPSARTPFDTPNPIP